MSTLHVHILMLALGLLAFLFIAGTGRRKKYYPEKRKTDTGKYVLGIVAGLIIAVAPFSKLWRAQSDSVELLIQSLLVAAVGLLVLLLIALACSAFASFNQSRSRKSEPKAEKEVADIAAVNEKAAKEKMAATKPILINADSDQTLPNSAAAAVTVDKSVSRADFSKTDRPDMSQAATQGIMANSNTSAKHDSKTNGSTQTPASQTPAAQNPANRMPDETKAASEAKSRQVTAGAAQKADSHAAKTKSLHIRDAKHGDNAKPASLASKVASKDAGKDSSATKTVRLKSAAVTEKTTTVEPTSEHKQAGAKGGKPAIAAVPQAHNISGINQKTGLASAANDKGKASHKPHTQSKVTSTAEKPTQDSAFSVPDDDLDLSDSQKLFTKMREESSEELKLPEDQTWLKDAAKKDSATFNDAKVASQEDLLIAERAPANDKAKQSQVSAVIEDAEFVESEPDSVNTVTDDALDFGNDLTGEYAHPTASKKPASIPGSLDEALLEAKKSAGSLQGSMDELESGLLQLEELRKLTIADQKLNQESSDLLLEQKQSLIESEDSARKAAESVIAAQSVLIDKARTQQELIAKMLKRERERLASQESEISRSREMARKAALLARRAAVSQQEIRNVAKREQLARIKSQESTRKAVNIARTAIDALAKEERKRGDLTH